MCCGNEIHENDSHFHILEMKMEQQYELLLSNNEKPFMCQPCFLNIPKKEISGACLPTGIDFETIK